ncbi:MAG TPA: NAD(P)-dependent oxidoreductase, partial [Streptosporangiaceae bacterium]
MSDRVLVPWQESRELAGDVSGAGLRVEVFSGDEPGPEDLKDVVFYTVPYDRPHNSEPLGRMPNLRVVQALTAGYEHLVDQVPAGTTLANARGLHDSSTAELALALLLAAQRELPRWVRAQEEHRWEHEHTRSLAGSRVLIVGYGSIGAALDRRLVAAEA